MSRGCVVEEVDFDADDDGTDMHGSTTGTGAGAGAKRTPLAPSPPKREYVTSINDIDDDGDEDAVVIEELPSEDWEDAAPLSLGPLERFLTRRQELEEQMQSRGAALAALQGVGSFDHVRSEGIWVCVNGVWKEGKYNGELRQQNREGQPVTSLLELFDVACEAREVLAGHVHKLARSLPDTTATVLPCVARDKISRRARDRDVAGKEPGPAWGWIFDVVRAHIVCKGEKDICDIVEYVTNVADHLQVIQLHNGFAGASLDGPLGRPRVRLVVRVVVVAGDPDGDIPAVHHNCEVALYLSSMAGDASVEQEDEEIEEAVRAYFGAGELGVEAKVALVRLLQHGGARAVRQAATAEG